MRKLSFNGSTQFNAPQDATKSDGGVTTTDANAQADAQPGASAPSAMWRLDDGMPEISAGRVHQLQEAVMKGIYRLEANYGRMGDISGIFIADSSDIEAIIGKTVYFGEVLGKHSDVDLDISEDVCKLISSEEADVAMFERLELATGYNPFDYWEGPDEDEDDE